MKAVVFRGVGEMSLKEVPYPEIGSNEALLRVEMAGICGTDLRIYRFGHRKIPVGTHRILGHEVAGTIVEVGNEVGAFLHVGQRVIVAPNIGCGKCLSCSRGYDNLCQDYDAFGISMDGGFAEYMKLTPRAIYKGNVIEIHDSISFEEGMMCETLSCCYHGFTQCKLRPAETALIIGGGPIGLLHTQLAKLSGASKVIVSDLIEERLAQAEKLSADVTVNIKKQNLKEVVMDMTDGVGMDVIIVACPEPSAVKESLSLAAIGGRINIFGGIPPEKEEVPLSTRLIHYREIFVTGTTGSNLEHFKLSLQLIRAKKVDVKSLVTDVLSLRDVPNYFKKPTAKIKAAVSPQI